MNRFANSFSHALIESMVLAKPYFTHEGMIVAEDRDGKVLGFVHAGFAPNDSWSDLDVAEGVVAILLVDPAAAPAELVGGLLNAAEEYLIRCGSKKIHFGSRFPQSPFYMGLFGGSQIPGLLVEQQGELVSYLRSVGYQELHQVHIFQRRMGDFRPIVDRQQTFVRRNYQVESVMDPQPLSWWESCTLGDTDRTRYLLFDRKTEKQCGNVTFWDIQPLSRDWGMRAMGLYDLRVDRDARKSGLATFLVGESIKHLQQYGTALIEAQVRSNNEPALKLFRKFGFGEVDMGVSLVKVVG